MSRWAGIWASEQIRWAGAYLIRWAGQQVSRYCERGAGEYVCRWAYGHVSRWACEHVSSWASMVRSWACEQVSRWACKQVSRWACVQVSKYGEKGSMWAGEQVCEQVLWGGSRWAAKPVSRSADMVTTEQASFRGGQQRNHKCKRLLNSIHVSWKTLSSILPHMMWTEMTFESKEMILSLGYCTAEHFYGEFREYIFKA